jgi:sec-independent protein translocase protein TatB
LVVIGPERLPRVARTVGHLLGRLQRYVSDVKSDIQREMQIEDLKKLQQQVAESARQLETSVRSQMEAVESDLGKTAAAAAAALAVEAATPPPTLAEAVAADKAGDEALRAHLLERDALAGPPAFGDAAPPADTDAGASAQMELGLELPPVGPGDKPA